MVTDRSKRRGLLAALLIAAALLFVVSVNAERSVESHTSAAAEASESQEAGHSGAEQGNPEGSQGHVENKAEGSSQDRHAGNEILLGIDIENPLIVGSAVLLSVVLAAPAFTSTKRNILVVVALFALAFGLLDGREVFHQLNEGRAGVAALASAVALMHLGAAGIAAREASKRLSV